MGIGGRCAACKYLRKRCPTDCIFSPYFPPNDPLRFEYVHRIYGASNVARMLQRIRVDLREEAAETLYLEAHCRVKDPVYGCVRIIDELQQQLLEAHNELTKAQTQIALVLDAIGPPSEPVIDHLNSNDLEYSSSFSNYNGGLLPFGDLPTLGL